MNTTIPHLPVGTMLAGGKYRITRFIDAGGFGCTYEAEFVPMKSRVAIKEFFVSACCNRDATGTVSVGIVSQAALVDRLEEKFRTEAQRLFSLKHPGIVSVTDILAENGTSYYVMDYIPGHSLQSLIEHNGPLPEACALRYIGQVMDALEYVHGGNMLHLDIKPDNIMIDERTDSAILIDFGVSKQYDEVNGYNTSTIMDHTPGYAPPEQVGNSIRQFTPASDIYALGATLYTALTACVPPSSTDLISGEAELQPLPPATSAPTRQAIAAMMQPTVKRRPHSVAAVRSLLGSAPETDSDTNATKIADRPQLSEQEKNILEIFQVEKSKGGIFVCHRMRNNALQYARSIRYPETKVDKLMMDHFPDEYRNRNQHIGLLVSLFLAVLFLLIGSVCMMIVLVLLIDDPSEYNFSNDNFLASFIGGVCGAIIGLILLRRYKSLKRQINQVQSNNTATR